MSKQYKNTRQPGHPLASAGGSLRLSRAVLYEKIGPGSHPCYYCGKTVTWIVRAANRPLPNELTVEHLDSDTLNDSPDNLVPACLHCNLLRGDTIAAHNAAKDSCAHGHSFSPDNTYVTKKGERVCRICQNASMYSYEHGSARFRRLESKRIRERARRAKQRLE